MNPVPDAGQSSPLGATVRQGGVDFSLFSRSASGVELLFFDREDDRRPARVMRIDPALNRTYHYWHIFVPGVQPGQMYPQLLRVWAIGETPLSSFRGLATSSQTTEGLFGFLG